MNSDETWGATTVKFLWRRFLNITSLVIALLILMGFGVPISWATFWLILLAYVTITALLPIIIMVPVIIAMATVAWGAQESQKAS